MAVQAGPVVAGLAAAWLPGTPASAAPAPAVDPAVTMLHLAAVGTVRETPDLLTAALAGTATAADPAAAQRQLDARMRSAAGMASGVAGLDWRVADYAVDQTPPDQKTGRTTWTATQTLHLQSGDADTLLALVGRLQGAGLAVQSLQWVLSPVRLAEAERQASQQALQELRARAAAAAATLGLKVAGMRSVTLGDADRPRPLPMMRMMAAPQATRSEADVSERAEGEIALTP